MVSKVIENLDGRGNWVGLIRIKRGILFRGSEMTERMRLVVRFEGGIGRLRRERSIFGFFLGGTRCMHGAVKLIYPYKHGSS